MQNAKNFISNIERLEISLNELTKSRDKLSLCLDPPVQIQPTYLRSLPFS